MKNINITQEQCETALKLAQHSIKHHPVSDIYKNDGPDSNGVQGEQLSLERRFRGTLGEIIYADYYGFERPKKSFGAVDGQDNGRDFSSPIEPTKSVDVKTMRRTSPVIRPYYVANLENRQVSKKDSLTDLYFVITVVGKTGDFHPKEAILNGYISPNELKEKATFYPAGSQVTNDWGKVINHPRDTYEIEFKYLHEPW